MANRAPATRRSAAQWKKLITAWRRSGLSAAQFAAEHGLRATTLQWWRWNLARSPSTPEPTPTSPRLVAVEMLPDGVTASDCPDVAWEIEGAGGVVLRVRTTIDAAALERVLLAMRAP